MIELMTKNRNTKIYNFLCFKSHYGCNGTACGFLMTPLLESFAKLTLPRSAKKPLLDQTSICRPGRGVHTAEVANDVFTSNEAKIVMIADHYMHKFFPPPNDDT